MGIPCELVAWGNFYQLARELAWQIREAVFYPEVIVAIGRGGYVPDYYAEEISEWHWIIYPWAVIEDLTSFLRSMEPLPNTVEAFAADLLERHGIVVPQQILQDVMSLSSRPG